MNVVRNLIRPSLSNTGLLKNPFQALATNSSSQSLLFNQQQQQQSHQNQQQIRFISAKYISKAARKRMPLTTKRAGKGFYKGNGSTKEGRLNSKAKFITDPRKQVELVVPDLEGFTVSFKLFCLYIIY
jgi:hypothetical protein